MRKQRVREPNKQTTATAQGPLVRPLMPNTEDEQRSVYLRMRRRLIDEEFDDDMVDWIRETAGEEQADAWGPPDTSLNPIASNTRQLVTPGLYGRTPSFHFPPAGEALLGPEGYIEKAGIFGRNQGLQYLTVGMGVYLRKINVVDIGNGTQLVDRLVDPSNVIVWVNEANPMEPVAIWDLRVRHMVKNGTMQAFYAWDKTDISNKAAPSFKVVRMDGAGNESEDITAQVASEEIAAGQYDWLDPDGNPFLPYIVYRAVDTGTFWPMYRRGMHRGTLRACAHWTYTSRSALFATGEHVLLSGVESLPGIEVRHGQDNMESWKQPVLSMRIHPGSISLIHEAEGRTMNAEHIGPGVNLPNLSAFANMYHMLLAVADGLHPTDATRESANPTSGAALEISAQSRREYSIQVQPFFRASDMEVIRKAAWMLQRAGQTSIPDTGYSLTYHTIPLAPTEQEELRNDLEWQETHGQLFPVDVHLRLYPGKTQEQAREAVITAQVETAKIAAEVQKRLAAAGITPPARPPADPAQLPEIAPTENPAVKVDPESISTDKDPTEPKGA